MLDNNTMLLKINMKLQVPFIMLRTDYLFAYARGKNNNNGFELKLNRATIKSTRITLT